MWRKVVVLFVILTFVGAGLAGCRVAPDDEIELEDMPEPAPGGGCPEGYEDGFDNSASPYIGGTEEVLVTVSMSTDFHCPWCALLAENLASFHDDSKREKYARIYYHHFPLDQHEDVLPIHKAAVAVQNQSNEGFWSVHDEVFARELDDDRMTIEELVDFVDTNTSIDMAQFDLDRASEETVDFLENEKDQALKQGLTGTPSVWVCGIKIGHSHLEETVDYFLQDVE